MTTLVSQSYKGIRSYNDENFQTLDFINPQTIIQGENGSGKTTIVEAQKYVLCGSQPYLADGGKRFVCDPKLLKKKVVYGEINVILRRVNEQKYKITRQFIVKDICTRNGIETLQFKQTNSNINQLCEESNGIDTKKFLSPTEMEKQVPEQIGVSRSVLENAVLCHQEENTWPLDEDAKLKIKFDAMFESSRYNDVIDTIRKVRKDVDISYTNNTAEVDKYLLHKNEYNRYKDEYNQQQLSIDNCNKTIHKQNDELQSIGSKRIRIEKKKNSYDRLKQKNESQKLLQQNNDIKRQDISVMLSTIIVSSSSESESESLVELSSEITASVISRNNNNITWKYTRISRYIQKQQIEQKEEIIWWEKNIGCDGTIKRIKIPIHTIQNTIREYINSMDIINILKDNDQNKSINDLKIVYRQCYTIQKYYDIKEYCAFGTIVDKEMDMLNIVEILQPKCIEQINNKYKRWDYLNTRLKDINNELIINLKEEYYKNNINKYTVLYTANSTIDISKIYDDIEQKMDEYKIIERLQFVSQKTVDISTTINCDDQISNDLINELECKFSAKYTQDIINNFNDIIDTISWCRLIILYKDVKNISYNESLNECNKLFNINKINNILQLYAITYDYNIEKNIQNIEEDMIKELQDIILKQNTINDKKIINYYNEWKQYNTIIKVLYNTIIQDDNITILTYNGWKKRIIILKKIINDIQKIKELNIEKNIIKKELDDMNNDITVLFTTIKDKDNLIISVDNDNNINKYEQIQNMLKLYDKIKNLKKILLKKNTINDIKYQEEQQRQNQLMNIEFTNIIDKALIYEDEQEKQQDIYNFELEKYIEYQQQFARQEEEQDSDDNSNGNGNKNIQDDIAKQIKKENNLMIEIGRENGKLEIQNQRKKDLNQLLNKEIYNNINQQYTNKRIKLCIDKQLGNDLERIYRALEKSILVYHEEKQQIINETLQEYWREIYHGNDIDTIFVRSEIYGDDTITTTNTVKNIFRGKKFRYRVVMRLHNGIEMDMRGRCSLGQKMLASLLIRIAVADAFCTECAILTLDEPTTNLDKENSTLLGNALVDLIQKRLYNKHFQLIIITHDQQFVEQLMFRTRSESYYRVSKTSEGNSILQRVYV